MNADREQKQYHAKRGELDVTTEEARLGVIKADWGEKRTRPFCEGS